MTDSPSPAEHPAATTGAVGDPDDDAVTLRPVETDTRRIVVVGTALFAVAFVVLLVLRLTAPDWSADHSAWVWIAFAGLVLGVIGWVIVGRHRRLGRTR